MTAVAHALPAPGEAVVELTIARIEEAIGGSLRSPRGRVILPFHLDDHATLHRMLNAMQPGSYVRPHRHRDPPKDEAAIVLRGAAACIIFDDEGRVRDSLRLAAQGHEFGVDIKAGVWHTFFALAPDTVLFEAKTGPYDALTDKEFASWAPAEGSPEAQAYLAGWTEYFA
jgi:cupin fold WbuC family metalloprotein